MNPRDHRLFIEYPLLGSATISTGRAPTPYHVYDGYGAFIGGTADLGPIQQLLWNETVTPLQTTNGRAFMGIWVCNFTDASLGPIMSCNSHFSHPAAATNTSSLSR